ncbi:thiamine-phosphate kinase [Salinisphaera hydrothermalis]|uniref:Thiamine-monophosphate kinase n=1 Tax=Salinisphaera hydrothermalis (strain C41B8) TaxID=1304275 RepID=A0A084IMF9_SALHC|nr:thiamine-phosphate kinase [Salinisphaera hydrothermalis]KEZ77893.1 thiamine-monophosphate kinase [Salinisphaera hydrothermalis C41B8]
MREFELIDSLRRRLAATRADTRLGIGDDAAILAPPPGHEVVITTDTLIAGRHFPDDTPPEDIGFKSIAVNLSDLAAMGADPAWLTIALAAPALSAGWCDRFIDGILEALSDTGVDVVGGDTTKSDTLTISVTALGLVPAGAALRRDGARVGDLVAVTGSLGDAAAGLTCWPHRDGASADERALISRLTRPTARHGRRLRGRVHAAIDVSDGLLADVGHMLSLSGVGATIDADALPASPALARYAASVDERRRLQATGGDDYELCVTLPEDALDSARAALDCPFTVIGRIESQPGLRLTDAHGDTLDPQWLARAGWDHFDGH